MVGGAGIDVRPWVDGVIGAGTLIFGAAGVLIMEAGALGSTPVALKVIPKAGLIKVTISLVRALTLRPAAGTFGGVGVVGSAGIATLGAVGAGGGPIIFVAGVARVI